MSWECPIATIPLLLAILAVPGFGSLWTANAGDTSGPYRAEGATPELGSVNEYMEANGEVVVARYVPLLGIYVFEDRGKLSSGQQISGLSVMSVDRPGPADNASGPSTFEYSEWRRKWVWVSF